MSFQVTVEPTKLTFSVNPDETILDAALRAQVGLPYGCKAGACSACKCKLASGTVDHGAHQATALSLEEENKGMVLTCCAQPRSDLVLQVRIAAEAAPFNIRKLPVRVAALEPMNEDVMRITLELPANHGFEYHAGQYVDLILRDGTRRSYSIANAPHTLTAGKATLDLHIRLVPGGRFSTHVFEQMKARDILRLEGPLGTFYLRESSPAPLIMLASGTGIAPLKAILEHMQHMKHTRPVHLYWGNWRPNGFYLDDWIQTQIAIMPDLTYIPVASDSLPQDGWQGRTGSVHHAVMADFASLKNYQVYACGSPAMVSAAQRDFVLERDLPEDAFFADAFATRADMQQTIE